MKAPAVRSFAAAALLLAVPAMHTALATGAANYTSEVARNRTSGKGPFGEERPFLETLIPPPYHTHAYHNPFTKADGEDLSQKLYRAYETTRIVGPGKPSVPDPDNMLQARLMMLLKDEKKVAHVLQEMDRRRSLPGDPYGTGGKRQLKGTPVFHEATWISNMTAMQLQLKAPSWHGWFVLRMTTNCDTCDQALSATDYWAHRVWNNPELRMCAKFGVIDVLQDPFQSPAVKLQATGTRPALHWVAPLHEHHDDHQELEAFSGPWSQKALGDFIHRRCTRVTQVGRVYAADILATHFANDSSRADQQSILESLRLLQVHHSDGHSDVPAKEFFRYYAEVMEDALEATVPAVEYYEAEVARIEQWLWEEQFHDALTEVMAIKLNVLQAFRQSAAHPEDVHAEFYDVGDDYTIDDTQDIMGQDWHDHEVYDVDEDLEWEGGHSW
eukprot:jgi/Ulvmu1/5841/UM025_0100.1